MRGERKKANNKWRNLIMYKFFISRWSCWCRKGVHEASRDWPGSPSSPCPAPPPGASQGSGGWPQRHGILWLGVTPPPSLALSSLSPLHSNSGIYVEYVNISQSFFILATHGVLFIIWILFLQVIEVMHVRNRDTLKTLPKYCCCWPFN